MGFIAVYITFPDKETASTISDQIISEKVVACANIFPITSSYWWKSEIQNEDEWVAIVKTTTDKWMELQQKIEALHPYEIPCIVKFEVTANQAYEDWIHSSLK